MNTRDLLLARLNYINQELEQLHHDAEAASEQRAEAIMDHVCSGFSRKSFSAPDHGYPILQRVWDLLDESRRIENALSPHWWWQESLDQEAPGTPDSSVDVPF